MCNESLKNIEELMVKNKIFKTITITKFSSIEIENNTEKETQVISEEMFINDFKDSLSLPLITEEIRIVLINHGLKQGKTRTFIFLKLKLTKGV